MKLLSIATILFLLFLKNDIAAQVNCNQCVISNPINNGLIACYPFSGNSQDQSGFNNHGTNYGATLTTDRFGNPNSAYYFDGNSYILAPNSVSLSSPTNNLTMMFWVNISNWSPYFTQNYASVICKSNSSLNCQYRSSLTPDGISQINNNNLWSLTGTTINLNQWYFVVVVVSGNTCKLYINGILVSQGSSAGSFPFSSNNPLYIGRDDAGTLDYYTGKIDDIRIYNRSLTNNEIFAIYNFQPVIKANAGIDKSICIGDSVQLNGSGGSKYKWNNKIFLSNDSIAKPFTRTVITTDYILTVSDGVCEDKDTVKINVNSKPLVKITGNSTICSGDSIQLNASGATKFIWNNGIYLNSDTISNPIAKPNTNTTFIVQGFNGSCSDRDTLKIAVTNKPLIKIIGNNTICLGDSVQLNASGATKFIWNNGIYLNSDTIANPIAKPNINTTFIVQGFIGSCSERDTLIITVKNKPSTKITGNNLICLGDSIQLNASGATKFIWNNGIFLSSDTISNPIAKPTTNTAFIVEGFIGNCSSKDTFNITLSTLTPDAGLDKNICIGDSVQLNASGGTKYEWLTNNTLSDTSTNNPYAKPTANTKYYVLISDGICKRKMDSVEVFVVSNLIADAGKDTSLCKNDSIQLNAIGGSSFVWTPITGLSQNNIHNPIAKPTISTKYYLRSTLGKCLADDSITITINEKPIINVDLDKTICKGESYLINNVSNADKYTWTPNYFLDNYLIKSPKTTPDTSLQYVVKAENSTNGCMNFDTIKITVNNPIADFKSSTLEGIVPLNITFNNKSTPRNITSFWDFGNSETSSLTNALVTYTKTGKYKITLIVTDSNNCRDTAMDEITVNGRVKFNIPNVFTPNSDNLNDVFKIVFSDTSQIEYVKGTIWNRWGGLIYEFSYPISTWWDGTYNGNFCSEGVYFYIFNIKTIYGETFEYHGTVTLLR